MKNWLAPKQENLCTRSVGIKIMTKHTWSHHFLTILSMPNSKKVKNPYKKAKAKRIVTEATVGKSAKSVRHYGIEAYNDFALDNDFLPFDELTLDYLTEIIEEESGKDRLDSLMRRFAEFIIRDDAGKKKKGFEPNGCKQYYSSFKSALADKFDIPKLKPPNDTWVNDLTKYVQNKAAARNMKDGKAVSNGASAIWRTILIAICEELLKQNNSTVSKQV